ncbi:MAG: flagellar filament capping protein FliD, partial [Thermogutta sp.]
INDLGGTTAKDLGLLRESTLRDFNGDSDYVIDGSLTYHIELDENDTLTTLAEKINSLKAGVKASILYDGSTRPYRLSLVGERGGNVAQLVLDDSQLGIDLQRISEARDAQLALGSVGTAGAVVLSSRTSTFSGIVPGLELDVLQGTNTPVNVQVQTSDADLVASVQTFVDNFNKFWKRYKELTKYDTETQKGEVLASDPTAIRLGSEVSYLLSSRFAGAGKIQSLAEIGISINQDGSLSFDSSVLQAKYAEDPEAVKKFFTDATFGFAKKYDKLSESLAGENVSLISQRLNALSQKYEDNSEKIKWWNEKLERRRQQLLLYFYRLENTIAKLKANLDTLSALQPISYDWLRKSK